MSRFNEIFFANLLTIRVSSRIVKENAKTGRGAHRWLVCSIYVSRYGLNPSSDQDWSHHGYGTD